MLVWLWEKGNTLLLVEVHIGAGMMETSVEASQKAKNITRTSSITPEHIPKGIYIYRDTCSSRFISALSQ